MEGITAWKQALSARKLGIWGGSDMDRNCNRGSLRRPGGGSRPEAAPKDAQVRHVRRLDRQSPGQVRRQATPPLVAVQRLSTLRPRDCESRAPQSGGLPAWVDWIAGTMDCATEWYRVDPAHRVPESAQLQPHSQLAFQSTARTILLSTLSSYLAYTYHTYVPIVPIII